jgi:Uma2 family endonuclease
VRTIVLGDPPAELQALIEQRRATGADRYDEVWEGEYHMAPAPHGAHGRLGWTLAALLEPLARRVGLHGSDAFNLGEANDYRVPDAGLHRTGATATWNATAALVVEIVSPDDETWEKLPFYAAHGVDEVLIVDPTRRAVTWLACIADGYEPIDRSALLDIDVAEVASRIEWPSVDAD